MVTLPQKPTLLITGAAGNLGGLLARHLLAADVQLRLMVHKTPVSADLESAESTTVVKADLAKKATLARAVEDVDVVVHFAGVLFAPRPEKFLPVTNTQWFENLVDASVEASVRRVVLMSFPHVEGPTTIASPATGRLDRSPISVHAQTRLAEEQLLYTKTEGTETTPVVLRLGMVYGDSVLMVDAARWLARHWLLGVWTQPTHIQLISIPDYLSATEAACLLPDVEGTYHLGDERPTTLQALPDECCQVWGCKKPWRMPLWMIYTAAALTEFAAALLRKPAPLTRDFISIGRVSYWGDTARMRDELLPELRYPTFQDGKSTLLHGPA